MDQYSLENPFPRIRVIEREKEFREMFRHVINVNRTITIMIATVLLLDVSFKANAQKTFDILDSVIYSPSGIVAAKIYKDTVQYPRHREIRFYDNEGFLVYSVVQDQTNDNLINNYHIVLQKDPIFLSDTFAIGFVNKVKSIEGENNLEKYKNTLAYYYSFRMLSDSTAVASLLKQHLITPRFQPKTEGLLTRIFISHRPFKGMQKPDGRIFNIPKKVLFDGIQFSEKEKDAMSGMLIFEFIVDVLGDVKDIKLITKVNPYQQEKLLKNLTKYGDIIDWKPGSSSYRAENIKAALWVDID